MRVNTTNKIPFWCRGLLTISAGILFYLLFIFISSQISVSEDRHYSSSPKTVLGVVVDKNLQVVSVETDSVAEAAGIRPGDVLKKIENIDLTANNFIQIISDKIQDFVTTGKDQTSSKMNLVILRGVQELKLSFTPISIKGVPGPTPTAVPNDKYYV